MRKQNIDHEKYVKEFVASRKLDHKILKVIYISMLLTV